MTATDRKTMSADPKLYSVLVYTDAAPASFLAVKSLAYADDLGGRDAESRPILWTLEATGQEGDYTLLLVDVERADVDIGAERLVEIELPGEGREEDELDGTGARFYVSLGDEEDPDAVVVPGQVVVVFEGQTGHWRVTLTDADSQRPLKIAPAFGVGVVDWSDDLDMVSGLAGAALRALVQWVIGLGGTEAPAPITISGRMP